VVDVSADRDARRLLQADPVLGPVVSGVPLQRLEPAPSFFGRFVRSVIRQQISMDAAAAIERRLHATVGATPVAVATAVPAQLRAVGLSQQKAETVQAIAAAVAAGTLTRGVLEPLDDAAVIDRLTQIRGVGPWTAKMQLIFALGRPDVFAVEDLAVRRALAAVTGEDDRTAMRTLAETWRPYRSYACLYLWAGAGD
jgi:DNA-3-methyladenine glycosylase II